jgi:hypothetical protein
MKKIKNIIFTILAIVILGSFFHKIIYRVISNYLLKNNAKITNAVIIDEKNYSPNAYVTFPYAYSYEFEINGRKYKNNSHDPGLKIGDSVEIEYNKTWPSFNRPLHQKE